MTLSTTASRVSYAGNGATTSFAFAFKVFAAGDLKVYLRDTTALTDTLQVLGVDYSVTGTLPGTGNVNFLLAAPATGKNVVIARDATTTQDLDLTPNGAFAADSVEAELDKICTFIQALEEQSSRSLMFPVGGAFTGAVLPEPTVAQAFSFLGIDATGTKYALLAQSNVLTAVVSAYVATFIPAANAAAARTILGNGDIRVTGITYDPASLTTGSETESADIAVNGAALGDLVEVYAPYDTQGIAVFGRVRVANTVRIRLRNGTAGTIDLANSAAWEVRVKKGGQA